jgi:hypothetical protein
VRQAHRAVDEHALAVRPAVVQQADHAFEFLARRWACGAEGGDAG